MYFAGGWDFGVGSSLKSIEWAGWGLSGPASVENSPGCHWAGAQQTNKRTQSVKPQERAIVTPTEKVFWSKNLVRCCGLFEAILGSAFVDEEWGSWGSGWRPPAPWVYKGPSAEVIIGIIIIFNVLDQVDQKTRSRGLCGCFSLLQRGSRRRRQWGLWVAHHFYYHPRSGWFAIIVILFRTSIIPLLHIPSSWFPGGLSPASPSSSSSSPYPSPSASASRWMFFLTKPSQFWS